MFYYIEQASYYARVNSFNKDFISLSDKAFFIENSTLKYYDLTTFVITAEAKEYNINQGSWYWLNSSGSDGFEMEIKTVMPATSMEYKNEAIYAALDGALTRKEYNVYIAPGGEVVTLLLNDENFNYTIVKLQPLN